MLWISGMDLIHPGDLHLLSSQLELRQARTLASGRQEVC